MLLGIVLILCMAAALYLVWRAWGWDYMAFGLVVAIAHFGGAFRWVAAVLLVEHLGYLAWRWWTRRRVPTSAA